MDFSFRPAKADPDPDGVELATVKMPLEEATKFVTVLRSYNAEKLDSQELGFEVYFRKERMLLALSCVQRAIKIAGRAHPTVHAMTVRLCKSGNTSIHLFVPLHGRPLCTVAEMRKKTEVEDVTPAGEVLKEGIDALLQGRTVHQFNQDYMERESASSILHRVVGIEMLMILDPEHKAAHAESFLKSEEITKQRPSLKDCEKVHQILLGPVFAAPEVADQWQKRCAEWFPRSSYFAGSLMTHLPDPERHKCEEVTSPS